MNDPADTVPPGFSAPGVARSPYTVRLPTFWADVDQLGHVNNMVYLRWYEEARMRYFELVGLAALHRHEGKGPILARTEVDYLAPVEYPDTLLVSTRAARVGNSSFTLETAIHAERMGRLVSRGRFVIVVVDYANGGAKTRVPETVRAAMRALEGPGLDEG